MKRTMKAIGIGLLSLLAIVLLISLSFGGKVLNLKFNEWFKPQVANVEREVFQKTRSYNESKAQDLTKYRLEYLQLKQADDLEGAAAVKSTIQMMYSDYDSSLLEPQLRSFLENEIMGYNQFQ